MSKKIKIGILAGALLALLGGGAWLILRGGGSDGVRDILRGPVYTVKRGDMLVSITEGGAVEAVREVRINSEVTGQRRIISVVDEGTYVKKGDLLVELDTSELHEKYDQEKISYQSDLSAYEQAKESLEITKSQNATNIREAELKVKFAEIELEKYRDGDGPLEIKNAQSAITVAAADLEQARDRLAWTEKLQEKGYATRSELEGDRLAVKRKEIDLEKAREKLRLLKKYTIPQKLAKLKSDVTKTKEELDRVKRRSNASLAQKRADLKAKEAKKSYRETKLKWWEEQIKKARITAPQDGLVVYPQGRWHRSQNAIEVGSMVHQRQQLIKLPDTSRMKVGVKVHESSMSLLQLGQLAYVSIDALPERRFRGKVSKLAVMPDPQSRWLNPDLKVYSTEILIEDDLPAEVKPGLSARVEIVVTKLDDVLRVPIQSVTTIDGKQVCFVRQLTDVEARQVSVGLFNDTDIQIVAGLEEGDEVLLNPPATSEAENLGIRVISSEEVTAADLKKAEAAKERLAAEAAAREEARNGETDLGLPQEVLDRIPADKREAFIKRLKAMTPAERKAMRDRLKQGNGRRRGSKSGT